MVLALLRPPTAGLGRGRDHAALAEHPRDGPRVLEGGPAGRGDALAVSRVGQLRVDPQRGHLADEPLSSPARTGRPRRE